MKKITTFLFSPLYWILSSSEQRENRRNQQQLKLKNTQLTEIDNQLDSQWKVVEKLTSKLENCAGWAREIKEKDRAREFVVFKRIMQLRTALAEGADTHRHAIDLSKLSSAVELTIDREDLLLYQQEINELVYERDAAKIALKQEQALCPESATPSLTTLDKEIQAAKGVDPETKVQSIPEKINDKKNGIAQTVHL